MTDRALVLPGRAYPASMPLLFFARLSLEQHGWPVDAVSWELPDGLPEDPSAWVAERAAAAVAAAPADHRIVVAKSLGTRIVGSSMLFGAYVLLTPLLHEPDQVAAVTRLVAAGVPVLLVGGTADFAWSPDAARSTGAELCEVPDADHAMVVPGDAVRSAEAHLEVARAVDRFLTLLR